MSFDDIKSDDRVVGFNDVGGRFIGKVIRVNAEESSYVVAWETPGWDEFRPDDDPNPENVTTCFRHQLQKLSADSLRDQVVAFKKLSFEFGSNREMIKSGPKSPEAEGLSRAYFKAREDLLQAGLKLKEKGDRLSPVEKLVFRWAIWQQAAGYTSTLCLNFDSSDEAASIMAILNEAKKELFSNIEKLAE